jgi:hypothetical protein
MHAAVIAASLGPLLLAAGCASTAAPDDAPAWFVAALADEDSDFPALEEAPTETATNNDAAHWAAVAAQLNAALVAMRANPRNEAQTADDAAAFAEEARRELETTRDPN